MQSNTLTTENLSSSLFHLDPMHTCCVENDCFDEYDRVANCVVQLVQEGRPLRDVLTEEFIRWFGVELPASALTTLVEQFQDSGADQSTT